MIESPENVGENAIEAPQSNLESPNKINDEPQSLKFFEIIDNDGNLWRPILLDPEVTKIVTENIKKTGIKKWNLCSFSAN